MEINCICIQRNKNVLNQAYIFYLTSFVISSHESFVEISSSRLIDGGAAYYPSDIRREAITYSRRGWLSGTVTGSRW